MLIGIDPSLTSTGVVVLSDTGEYLAAAQIASSNAERMDVRCRSIAKRACDVLADFIGGPASERVSVYVEYPGGNLKGPAQNLLVAYWYIIDEFSRRVTEERLSIHAVAPQALTKYITSRGNAKKEDKCASIMARWMHLLPEQYQVSADAKGGITRFADLFDGLGLAQLGLTHLTGVGTAWQKEVAGKLTAIITPEQPAEEAVA